MAEHDDIHTPVLLERCIELLGPALQRPGAVFVDATLGMGGHSAGILERFPEVTAIERTQTLTAFRAYSKKDLQQAWDIGVE